MVQHGIKTYIYEIPISMNTLLVEEMPVFGATLIMAKIAKTKLITLIIEKLS